jgi:hypothetical protein
MFWSSEITRFVIGAYLALGGGIGALVGLAFGLLSRGRFSLEHFLYSVGLGVVGSGSALLILVGMQSETSGKVNGLLAELFGAETRVGDLLLLAIPALITVLGCAVITLLARRRSQVDG